MSAAAPVRACKQARASLGRGTRSSLMLIARQASQTLWAAQVATPKVLAVV